MNASRIRCAVAIAWTTSLLGLATTALAQGGSAPPCKPQTIILRSGQVGSAPGLPGQQDTNIKRTFAVDTTGGPLSLTPFTPNWFFPTPTGPAFIIAPVAPPWTANLPCDPEARWINWEISASNYGSTLYEMPFTIFPTTYQKVTLDLCWAIDDGLGDLYSGDPNPVGVYINGAPTTPSISGGNYATQTVVTGVDITALVNSGVNSIYFYQRDAGQSVSGFIFSATIHVECPCETINFRSGQVNGAPGLPGQQDSNVRWNPTVETTAAPLSNTAFNPAWFFPAANGPAAYVVTPILQWVQSLSCDGDARWINFSPSPFNWASTLYAMPINVTTTNIQSASLDFCWAVDDVLGDPPANGPNAAGVYLNGTPLPISGGSIFNQTSVSNVNISGILTPGINWLYIYQRDTFVSASGLIFSGQVNVRCGPPCPTITCYADCDGDGVLSIDDFICFQTMFAIGC